MERIDGVRVRLVEAHEIAPASGGSCSVSPGELVRIVDVDGEQVGDFTAYDPETNAWLSPSHTRAALGTISLPLGSELFSSRRDAVLRVVEDDVGVHDLLFPACDQRRYFLDYGMTEHASCLENLRVEFAAAGVEFGVVDPVNLFMNVAYERNGEFEIRRPRSRPGDAIVFEVLRHLVVGLSACPQDQNPCNGWKPTRLRMEVYVQDPSQGPEPEVSIASDDGKQRGRWLMERPRAEETGPVKGDGGGEEPPAAAATGTARRPAVGSGDPGPSPADGAASDSALASAGLGLGTRLSNVANRFGLLFAWAVVIAVFGAIVPETFLTTTNFQTIFGSQSVLIVVTLGLIIALTAGEIDLSIAGVLTLCVVVVAKLNIVAGWAIGPAILVALAAGVLVGVTNAFFVVKIGIESIVVTLGMGTFLVGLSFAIEESQLGGLSQALVDATRSQLFGVQLAFYYGLILTVLVWYVFAFTPLGRYLYFVGAGREVARMSGIRVQGIRAGALIASSLFAALGGVILAGLLGATDPNVGQSFLLPAFAGAFLGATAISPGRFNPWGSFIAVYFLVTGITGLQLLGLSGWIEQVFYGVSLILAVTLSRLVGRRQTDLETKLGQLSQ